MVYLNEWERGKKSMMTGNSRSGSSLDSAIWAAKLLLFSVGIISTIGLVKVVIIPYMLTFLLSSVPTVWMWITSWLCPPYIYILANFIILSVAASSTFFHHHHHHTQPQVSGPELGDDNHHHHTSDATQEFTPTISEDIMSRDIKVVKDDEEIMSRDIKVVKDEFVVKNPIAAAGADLSPPKALPKATSLSGLKDNDFPEADDTLDGMWKTIMEGKGKQLKKSETWKEQVVDVTVRDKREMRKSETYRERSESNNSTLRREMVVPCSEELNKKVEAFIKKINDEMRLQRLESDQRFNDMVSRGL